MKKKNVESAVVSGVGKEADGTVIRVVSLEQLMELCQQPIDVRLRLGQRDVVVQIHRLSTEHEEERLGIARKVTPPAVRKPDGKVDYNTEDPEYLRKFEAQMRLSRAVALYRACPILRRDSDAQNATHEVIQDWVHARLPDGVLDQLFRVLMTLDAGEAERANFTTAPDFLGS